MKRKIRGVVAYSATGKYLLAGWSGDETPDAADEALLDYVREWLPENVDEDVLGHHFITAEIEIPDPVPVAEVAAEVER